MNTAILRVLFSIRDTIFPAFCGSCGKEGSALCEPCFLALPRRISQTCGSCGIRETPIGKLCHECAGSPIDGLFSASRYDQRVISHLIHLFKYRFVRELGSPLGRLLAESVLRSDVPFPDAIIPVPLHPRRERWRGWNQAEILADELARWLPPDIAPPILRKRLIRTRFTTPQMPIREKSLRKLNIRGAFRANEATRGIDMPFDLQGKRLWIIDDVAASGATVSACAEALKQAGAAEVFGIVVAR